MNKTKTVNYIGLDMSLTGTGFTLKNGKQLIINTIKTVPKDFENDLDRLAHIVSEVIKQIPSNSFVCIEDVFTPSSPAQIGSSMKLIGLAYLIRKALYDAKLPFFICSPSQVKKFVSGKGTCPKDQVTKEVYKKWGVDTKDDNQADSVCMAYLAESLHKYITENTLDDLTKPQADVVKTVAHERPSYNVVVKKTSSEDTEN